MNSIRMGVTILLLVAVTSLSAATDIQVVGLFKNKAVLMIDGKQHILAAGQKGPAGVKVISANSKQTVLEVDGKRGTYVMGTRVGTNFSKPDSREVTVYKSDLGLFTSIGSINGYPVKFLIDTGASAVAMSETEARRLGIDYKLAGKKIVVNTASGSSRAYQVQLKAVKLGDIEQRDVEGYVLTGNEPRTVLLGMSFLGSLAIKNDGQVMHLETRY